MPYLKAAHLSQSGKKWNELANETSHKLIYSGGEIRFASEMELENYIEENFQLIFPDLDLVKRQFSIKMQRTDLLCSTKLDQQPVIVELKNEEDRGLVPQLIRYRKILLIEKPFAEKINYSLPVKLIAVTPKFHEDNYTDKEASKFEDDICFMQFSLKNTNNSGEFQLRGKSYDIPYPIFGLPSNSNNDVISSTMLPAFAHNFTNNIPSEYKQDFRDLRSLFIAQPKVKEMVSSSYRKILYATGDGRNHKKLAEITITNKGIFLFLWLPTAVNQRLKRPVARFGLVLEPNHNPFSRNSIVEWVVCTETAIDMKKKPTNLTSSGFNRNGMLIWSSGITYVAQASQGENNSLITSIIKNMNPNSNLEPYYLLASYKKQTPNNLGWYIDLAITTWNFRLK